MPNKPDEVAMKRKVKLAERLFPLISLVVIVGGTLLLSKGINILGRADGVLEQDIPAEVKQNARTKEQAIQSKLTIHGFIPPPVGELAENTPN